MKLFVLDIFSSWYFLIYRASPLMRESEPRTKRVLRGVVLSSQKCYLSFFSFPYTRKQGGGVFWVKGILNISEGTFSQNKASDSNGGVVLAPEGSSVTLSDGCFKGNKALMVV